ncbi:MAG: Gfo/Idh/MocA family oxidoreductase [Phycisphaerales bacterium]|nr:Gfo/Idh/MocA family oxidoreductase [Phycisphaerales bacterium]
MSRSIDRRSVLKAGVAIAGFPAILPSRVLREPPSGIIGIGIVGYGIRSKNLLYQFLNAPGTRVVGIAEVVDARREEGLKRARAHEAGRECAGYTDFREMMADPGVDAVMIGTPDHWHALPAITACRSGKHVYCEKPLSRTLVEGRAMADAAASAGIAFQTGSQQRTEFGTNFVRGAELVRCGAIGRISRVEIGVGDPPIADDLPDEECPEGIDWDGWLGSSPERGFNQELCPIGMHSHYPAWRRYREYAGGGLADMGAHHFDIAQWALDRDHTGPSRIIPPEDSTAKRGLRLIYADGIELVHDGSVDCRFVGEDGVIEAGRGYLRASDEKILETPVPDDARLPRSKSHILNWVAAMRGDEQTVAPAEVGHRTASVCQLAAIGYELGKPISWNPTTERFEGTYATEANGLRDRPRRTPLES